jgi:phosphoribosylanthranilate isomerase
MEFRVKICGITNVEDALAAVDAGAEAIGLNFFRGSRRCIGAEEARRITEAVAGRTACIGVFVNDRAETIRAVCAEAGLKLVQLHGDEPPEFLKQLYSGLQVIRARRLGAGGLPAVAADVAECRAACGFAPYAVLIDASVAGAFGGTGCTADWQRMVGFRQWVGEPPLILAGGLTPDNVAEAIRIVEPHAVDVASGVESSPGKKDRSKMRDFVAAARNAFS